MADNIEKLNADLEAMNKKVAFLEGALEETKKHVAFLETIIYQAKAVLKPIDRWDG